MPSIKNHKRATGSTRGDFIERLRLSIGKPGDIDYRPDLRATDFALIQDWNDHLQARGISWQTAKSYLADVAMWSRFCATRRPSAPTLTTANKRDLESWLADGNDRGLSESTAHRRYMSVRIFDKWAIANDIINTTRVPEQAPKVQLQDVRVIPNDSITKLLNTIKKSEGRLNDFRVARDIAIITMLLGTGMRADEMLSLTLDSRDRHNNTLTVNGKGNKERTFAIPNHLPNSYPSPLEALNNYMRMRNKHLTQVQIDTEALWIGPKGPLKYSGLVQMLERRCKQANIPVVSPLNFRHTFGHWAKVAGISDGDLKKIGGWSSDSMVHRYGRSEATTRAIDAHRNAFEGLNL